MRNPFFLRAAEQSEAELFVRLFSPEVLDLLPREEFIWETPIVLRSAPGGGKTSLLRLFTPQSLMTVHRLRAQDDFRELYRRLRDVGALGDDGLKVVGILLSCSRNYALLEQLDLESGRRRRLFFALLNARIIAAALRSCAAHRGLSAPLDLADMELEIRDSESLMGLGLDKAPTSALMMYEWACSVERAICEALDSFAPLTDARLPGHDSLYSLAALSSMTVSFRGSPVEGPFVVMLDDVQELSSDQRRSLLDRLFSARVALGVWLAERFEALRADELLARGALAERDYGEVISLEDHWRAKGGAAQFERFARGIAEKRVREHPEGGTIGGFSSCLVDSLDSVPWTEKFRAIASKEADDTLAAFEGRGTYKEWLTATTELQTTEWERAKAWRRTRILIEREERSYQKTLGFTLPSSVWEDSDAADLKGAAELFLAKEYGIPYYFGVPRLASVSSGNVEQFLRLASALFEEISAAAVMGASLLLPPERQHEIFKRIAQEEWGRLPVRVPEGFKVRRFLEAVGLFCRHETYKPNAPYAPGVTGIAILMSDRDRLRDPLFLDRSPGYSELSSVLASCIAYNLLDVKLDHSCKGKSWMLFHLNRLFCVHFDLPLTRSGWREKRLDELIGWMNSGFSVKRAAELV